MKVYLAVGHGLKPNGTFDPGAVSGPVTEQTSGDVIVKEAARLLRAAGVSVVDEAFTDDPNFVGSAAAANKWGADFTVAVHHDWTGGFEAHGFWYPGSAEGEKLCRAIIAQMKKRAIKVRDGSVKGRDLYILRKTTMPATLIEVGRIGDPSIDTDAERRQMGAIIAEGVAAHIGVALDPPAPPKVEVPESEWKYPDHAQSLLDKGVFTKWTGPGHNVDTDNLSAYIDRTIDHLSPVDTQLAARVAELEKKVAALSKTASTGGISPESAVKLVQTNIKVHAEDPDAHHD